MIRGIDHIVILVSDLAAASADYAALGFTVLPGGEHTGGATHNALVIFADDTYLELIALRQAGLRRALGLLRTVRLLGVLARGRPPLERHFLLRLAGGEGLADFALVPTSFTVAAAAARARGVALTGPIAGSRRLPDGREAAWQLGLPDTPDLPFLCADVTPRELRVPAGAARQHPNGVTGIAGVTVAVRDLEASTARYRALTDVEPGRSVGPAVPGARTVDFVLGETVLTLAAPSGGGGEVARHLARRGEGPLALRLRAPAGAVPGLGAAPVHGARLSLAPA
jgi:catechol 2,3-dioxygenase-like lactoylglutathione lyase family enzyme